MGLRPRSIIVFLVVMSVSMLALAPARVTDADHAITLYRGEQFGHFFFYESATWSVVDELSEPGSDFIRFTHGATVVDYWAFAAPGLAEADCIPVVLGSNPGILEIEALTQGGDPFPLDQVGTGPAWITLTEQGAAGPIQLSTLQECHELSPGGAFLYSSIRVPAGASQGFSQPWIRGYYETVSGQAHDPVAVIESFDGTSGSLTIDDCVQTDGLYVLAQGFAGREDFVVEPRSFVAALHAGGVELIPATWLYPATAAQAPLALGPGEIALVKLDTSNGSTIYYFPNREPPVRIGNVGACGGGGVSAPVIVDME